MATIRYQSLLYIEVGIIIPFMHVLLSAKLLSIEFNIRLVYESFHELRDIKSNQINIKRQALDQNIKDTLKSI